MPKSRLSILSNTASTDLKTEPYPHLVVRNALDDSVFAQLAEEYPAPAIVLDGRSEKDTWYDYPACSAIENTSISPLWQQFMQYHVSRDFYMDILEIFGTTIRTANPDLEHQLGKSLEDLDCSIRYPEREKNLKNRHCDLSMECQFYINYTKQARAVRGPHIDRPTELYAALLYFREERDNSTGSDLQICSAKDPASVYSKENSIRVDQLPMELDYEKVNVESTALYEANTLVFFLNSHKSLHAVTPRTATEVPRKHVNFTGDLFKLPGQGLFDVKHTPRNSLKSWLEEQPLVWRLANFL